PPPPRSTLFPYTTLFRSHMHNIEEMIEELDKEIAVRLKPYQQQLKLACTVPGIKPTAAASILAETGMDMSPEGPFPDCHHLASWATVCPGNDERPANEESAEHDRATGGASNLDANGMGWSGGQEVPFPDALP